jgi:hypothetical protein
MIHGFLIKDVCSGSSAGQTYAEITAFVKHALGMADTSG